jgi:hypothetical protein
MLYYRYGKRKDLRREPNHSGGRSVPIVVIRLIEVVAAGSLVI